MYKRQVQFTAHPVDDGPAVDGGPIVAVPARVVAADVVRHCLLYTSDAADERSSVDLGGRRIIKKKNNGPTITETHT